MFDRSKLESLRDVSVTRIGDTFSYGFPKTEFRNIYANEKKIVPKFQVESLTSMQNYPNISTFIIRSTEMSLNNF